MNEWEHVLDVCCTIKRPTTMCLAKKQKQKQQKNKLNERNFLPPKQINKQNGDLTLTETRDRSPELPRRSSRQRKPPEWLGSEESVMAHHVDRPE